MFTGIVETTGTVTSIEKGRSIITLRIASSVSAELKPDQSVSHDGVCLTVVSADSESHVVQVVEETLRRTNFANLKEGSELNLERAMPANGRFEGHIVQGHVDCTAEFIGMQNDLHLFRYPQEFEHLLVQKGSICLNGVSLTIALLERDLVGVALIPYTLEHTTLGKLRERHLVNIEFDILSKHLARYAMLHRLPLAL